LSKQKKEVVQNIKPNRRENIILSSALFDEECKMHAMQQKIPTQHFNNQRIRSILDIFNGLVENNTPPTTRLIVEQMYPQDNEINLQKREELHRSLKELKNKVPPVPLELFKEQINLLVKHAKLNNFDTLLDETKARIQAELNSPSYKTKDDSIDFLMDKIETDLDKFTLEKIKALNLGEGLKDSFQKVKEQRDNPSSERAYVTTGYDSLDGPLSGGFARSEFSIISARPSMGKTVVMLNMAIEAAKKGTKVLFLTVEMTLEQCLQRALSKTSDVKLQKIIQPEHLTHTDMQSLENSSKEVASVYGSKLLIEETPYLSPSSMRSRAKYYQELFGVELVFVDYVQIMRTNQGKVPSEISDYEAISDSLMNTAKELDVAFVMGSQLSRDVEKREDKRPLDSDLRNSGRFEQDAALIIHLYRDEVYNKDTEDKKVIEFLIGKNRFGVGHTMIPFSHDFSTQSIFENVS